MKSFFLLPAIWGAAGLCYAQSDLGLGLDSTAISAEGPPVSAPAAYDEAICAAELCRQALWERYQAAGSDEQRASFLSEAQAAAQRIICEDLIPHWYGTPWSFNGTSRLPGSGSIACGYFVTTVLRDAGYRLARVSLAQQASELIIRSLVSRENIRRFSDASMDRFIAALDAWGPGLYVVGLDIHVGFIVHDGQDAVFVHSSYVRPFQVVREPLRDAPILVASRYRVLGKLSADKGLAGKWLAADSIQTRTR